ncbi:MAG: rRNA maturation RNase YbeY [Nitriliruptorales bacterium]|nr:rRNA maturation RNase YbeY [Nitriliruptorales bacterium]
MAVFVADEQTRPIDVEHLRRLADFVLADRGVPASMDLSILCVDTGAIAALNAHHLGADGPTDVLAFPMDLPGESGPGEPSILGDVVLCPEIAAEQAARQGNTPEAELELLVAHGILHLLGHDHAEPEERDVMLGLTDRLLAEFRTARPEPAAGGGVEIDVEAP